MNLDAMRWRLKAIRWKAKAYDLLLSRQYWDEQACIAASEAQLYKRMYRQLLGDARAKQTQHDAGSMQKMVYICPNLKAPCPELEACSVANGGCREVWRQYDRSRPTHNRP